MTHQRIRIQNKLRLLASTGTFYPVVYDPATKSSFAGTQPILPKDCLTNEVSAVFETGHNRRTPIVDRTHWFFDLHIAFAQEVIFEVFEKQMRTIQQIAADPIDELPAVMIFLRSVRYTHPPQQQPSSGSEAHFVFEALEISA